jgi:GH15 family glucan-1,4-alpha-glucosidase
MTTNTEYPDIADHGLIGDLQTAALVSGSGSVDWFCAPRFDSPSIFASLLDRERGGHFSITATGHNVTTKQMYLADTAILVTRFLTPGGIGEVIDFMPVPESPATVTSQHSITRILRVTRGSVEFDLQCRPRFGYGTTAHQLALRDGQATFTADDITGYLRVTEPVELAADGNDVTATITLKQGGMAAAIFTSAALDDPAPATPDEDGIRRNFTDSGLFWQRWLSRCTYQGRWQQQVKRSAITLKMLVYAPTGAPIAAATMGLPEQPGGERNWDYRFTWIRDGSLTIKALLDLGFTDEAERFMGWLGDRLRAADSANGEPLQILYRVDGEPNCHEIELKEFEGWRQSAPVRAGNGAESQLQLDIYGEVGYALAFSSEVANAAGYDGWEAFRRLLDWLVDNWDRKDAGIWETRGGAQDFTYSRVMCWCAFDRGVSMGRMYGRPGDLDAWTQARDAILRQVMTDGWDPEQKAFVQHYGSNVLDASLLLAPVVGFVSSRDPRWLSTIEAMDDQLVSDSLVYRYNPAASPDGLKGSEGTFSLCSFLYVAALARAGKVGQARYAFDKMLTYSNHVGLFSEEIGPTGEQLGNFPQAFTHLALIDAALALDAELDRVEGLTRPRTEGHR